MPVTEFQEVIAMKLNAWVPLAMPEIVINSNCYGKRMSAAGEKSDETKNR